MSDKYPHEVIESAMRKQSARATRLPSSGANRRLAHKATPTKPCKARKASRMASEGVLLTHFTITASNGKVWQGYADNRSVAEALAEHQT